MCREHESVTPTQGKSNTYSSNSLALLFSYLLHILYTYLHTFMTANVIEKMSGSKPDSKSGSACQGRKNIAVSWIAWFKFTLLMTIRSNPISNINQILTNWLVLFALCLEKHLLFLNNSIQQELSEQ